MTDVLINNTANGGDILLRGNDLAIVDGYENTVFLSLFGGSDWILNFLIKNKYQCQTEETIKKTGLNSAGLATIKNAILNDLQYLATIPGTTYSATVKIVAPNKLNISVTINGKQFNANWNPDIQTLTMQ